MKKWVVALIISAVIASGVGIAAARGTFATSSLRGRYTGNVTISESIPNGDESVLNIEARALMALTFDGKSLANGIVSVTAFVPGSAQLLFTCVFTASGIYEIGDEGLGTAALDITPTTACAGPATLKMSLLVGGRNRSRLDVSIDGANGNPPGPTPIPLVGSGVLVSQ